MQDAISFSLINEAFINKSLNLTHLSGYGIVLFIRIFWVSVAVDAPVLVRFMSYGEHSLTSRETYFLSSSLYLIENKAILMSSGKRKIHSVGTDHPFDPTLNGYPREENVIFR
jgi:hypothetical protein